MSKKKIGVGFVLFSIVLCGLCFFVHIIFLIPLIIAAATFLVVGLTILLSINARVPLGWRNTLAICGIFLFCLAIVTGYLSVSTSIIVGVDFSSKSISAYLLYEAILLSVIALLLVSLKKPSNLSA